MSKILLLHDLKEKDLTRDLKDFLESIGASVNVEIGQLKERFKNMQGRIVYLQEKECASPTIHQKAHISFDRNDIRSILEALTLLIQELKKSKLLSSSKQNNFDTNWSKDYEGVKARVYTDWPKTALKTEKEIHVFFQCATHGLDLRETNTSDRYSHNDHFFYCELCKDGGGAYRKFKVDKIKEIKFSAISDYRKWLEAKLKEE